MRLLEKGGGRVATAKELVGETKMTDKFPTFEIETDTRVPRDTVDVQIFREPADLKAREIVQEMMEKARKIFERYDYDGSGTVNSPEELEQMITNVLFTLDYRVPSEAVTAKIAARKSNIHTEPMPFDEFWKFVISTFGPPQSVCS